MQAFSLWSPPSGTLGRIVEETRERVAVLRTRRPALEAAVRSAGQAPSFAAALSGTDVSIIAEVKRRSPSGGEINASISAAVQARAYRAGGARAISVLTEGAHFGGSPEDLEEIRGAVHLPLLKKDFHVDPLQLLEARVLRASAVLLIARALAPGALLELADTCRELGMDALVEVRDERELELAIRSGAGAIGVNNRNLETLVIDPRVCERLLPLLPPDRVAIYESGVKTRRDAEAAAALGADAILVGSVVSRAADPAAAVRELVGVPRAGRA